MFRVETPTRDTSRESVDSDVHKVRGHKLLSQARPQFPSGWDLHFAAPS
jgi:hypothetical protein